MKIELTELELQRLNKKIAIVNSLNSQFQAIQENLNKEQSELFDMIDIVAKEEVRRVDVKLNLQGNFLIIE